MGVDDKGNDITGSGRKMMQLTGDDNTQTGIVIEAGQRCPTLCAINSSLVKPD
ncbi:MAG: hypothetical protein V4520_02930 [Bacteroidota bacterium]